jgi:uncharacterized protein (TIGR00162 family)
MIQESMNVDIKTLKDFLPKEFILISGFPGIAYIGKLSVEYLVQQLKAEKIAEVYSKFFPPYTLIKKDGVVELLKNELFHFKHKKTNFVFLSGNAQAFSPEGQFEVVETILNWGLNHGLKKIYSIAAYALNKAIKKPVVYGTSTRSELLDEFKKLGVVPLDEGIIIGENGLIIGLAKKKNIEAVCLLGATRGYQTPAGQYLIDAKAAKEVISVLIKSLDLEINMDPLDKQAKDMDEIITKMTEVEQHIKNQMTQNTKRPSYVT